MPKFTRYFPLFSAPLRPVLLLALMVAHAPASAEQLSFFREFKNSNWHYRVGYRDSQGRRHLSYFQLSKPDIAIARTLLKNPRAIGKAIARAGRDNKRHLEGRLSLYADDLWQDVLNRTRRHADELMMALPSGSRIHIDTKSDGRYKFTGHLARDFRFWKYGAYERIMQQAIEDLQVYFRMQVAERERAIEIYRDDLERELHDSFDETSAQLMSQGLLVKNEYYGLHIDYREAVRKSLWPLRSLSLGLDSIGSDRDRVNKVLGFFQSIPYEAIDDNRHAHSSLGFRMPLVTINQNSGDCDSKAIGAAAVLKNLMPDRRMLLVLVPGHAFLAMQLSPRSGDDIVHYGGLQWVLLEPVGLALRPPGDIAPDSLRALESGVGISYVEL